MVRVLVSEFGAGSRTRTYEGLRREIYSLLSLPLDDSSIVVIISQIEMEPQLGLEPRTYGLQNRCSTNWAIAADCKWTR